MVLLAIYTLNVLHPGWLLERVYHQTAVSLREMSPSGSPRTSLLSLNLKAGGARVNMGEAE